MELDDDFLKKLNNKDLFAESTQRAKDYLSKIINLDIMLDRKKYNEFGEEDLINPELELQHTCQCVHDCIKDKDFTLEEALEAYKISKEDYEEFLKTK